MILSVNARDCGFDAVTFVSAGAGSMLDIDSWGRHVVSWLFCVIGPGGALECVSSGLCMVIKLNCWSFMLVQPYGGVGACSPFSISLYKVSVA